MRRRPAVAACLTVVALAVIAALGTVPAAADLASKPSVESESVSNVAATDATLEVQINPGGLETSYEVRVETLACTEEGGPGVNPACESTAEGQVTGTVPAGSSTQIVSVDIANAWHPLSPNTTYIFSARATNAIGNAYGSGKDFKTPDPPPAIEGESVSNITPTNATLEGQINPGGLDTAYEVKIESVACRMEGAGPSANPPCEFTAEGQVTGTVPAGSSTQTVSVDIAKAWHPLSPNTRYFYSMRATSAAGTAHGSEKEFETTASRPAIDSESVSNVAATDATLEVQINPGGLETSYEVRVETLACTEEGGPGVNPACESTAEGQVTGTVPAGSSTQTVSVDIANAWHPLSPNTTYIFSARATNAIGNAYGSGKWFATPPEPPGVTPLGPLTTPLVGPGSAPPGSQEPGSATHPPSAVQSQSHRSLPSRHCHRRHHSKRCTRAGHRASRKHHPSH